MSNLPLFRTIEGIRLFFAKHDFIETPTPPVVNNPGMEAHLHPFKVSSTYQGISCSRADLYLQTSPEFHMKKLLSEGLSKIYNLSYCFRDEPSSETHRFQFLMLEWYRAREHYSKIQEDTLELIEFVRLHLKSRNITVREKLKVKRYTVEELFTKYTKVSILDLLDAQKLKEAINQMHPELLPKHDDLWPWEDYFHFIFLNLIEPNFKNQDLVVVDEFPAPLAALSTLKKDNPKVCERFEIYLDGIELCNCFNELTNLEEQKRRMQLEAKQKKELYGYELPEPSILYQALEKGIPASAGIALGVERLLMGLTRSTEESFYS